MIPNLLYSYLIKNFNLRPEPGKPFIIIPIEKGTKQNFQGIKYCLEEQHLTVHKEFSRKDPTKSPIHFTAVYRDKNSRKLKIHGFYNEYGQFILAQARFEDSDKSVKLTPEEKLALEKLIEQEAKPQLKTFFNHLSTSQLAGMGKKASANEALIQESTLGVDTDAYISQLEATIKAINEVNELDFFPCYRLRDKFVNTLEFLKNNRKNKEKALKSQAKSKSQLLKIENSVVEEIPSDKTASNTISTSSVEVKSERVPSLPLNKLSEKELYQKLGECPVKDIKRMMQITKAIDNYEKTRIEKLFQACINGNIENFKELYKESDLILMPLLLSTTVNSNNLELFTYLWEINHLKNGLSYMRPFESISPREFGTVNSTSYLGLACFKTYYKFVKFLLEVCKVDPNDHLITGTPLISFLIEKEAPKEIIDAFLLAGADPNIKLQTYNFMVLDPAVEDLLIPELKKEQPKLSEYTPLFVATYSKHIEALELLLEHKADPNPKIKDNSPLYTAVILEDVKAVKLLLEHKAEPNTVVIDDTPLRAALRKVNAPIVKLLLEHNANSKDVDGEGFTLLAAVTHVKDRVVNKEIAEAFMKQGHKIDQRQGPGQSTGLYHQSQIGNLAGVKTLLELGAKPDALHQLKSFLGNVDSSPLAIAANKAVATSPQYLRIVKELLKYKPSLKAIKGAYEICRDPDCKEELRQAFYYNDLNSRAIKAMNSGQYEEAEGLFSKAIELPKKESDGYFIEYNYGVCLLKLGKTKEALKIFEALEKKEIGSNLLTKVTTKITQINTPDSTVTVHI